MIDVLINKLSIVHILFDDFPHFQEIFKINGVKQYLVTCLLVFLGFIVTNYSKLPVIYASFATALTALFRVIV